MFFVDDCADRSLTPQSLSAVPAVLPTPPLVPTPIIPPRFDQLSPAAAAVRTPSPLQRPVIAALPVSPLPVPLTSSATSSTLPDRGSNAGTVYFAAGSFPHSAGLAAGAAAYSAGFATSSDITYQFSHDLEPSRAFQPQNTSTDTVGQVWHLSAVSGRLIMQPACDWTLPWVVMLAVFMQRLS